MSISDAELNRMRADFAVWGLPQTATIARQGTSTNDSEGNPVPGTTTQTSASCQLSKASGAMIDMLADREANKEYYMLTVAYDTDLEYGDKVTISSVKYEVVQLWGAHDFRLGKRALVETVT